MTNERWEKLIRLVAQSVVKEHGAFWEHLNGLSYDVLKNKDIISKEETLLIIEVLENYEIK